MAKKPIVVMIRDGWGYRENPDANGPVHAQTPYTDHLMNTYPKTLLDASGEAVGLPPGYMGNSEVGHMTIGSGRIIYQSLMRISKSIEEGSFFQNPELLKAIENAKTKGSTLHLLGLIQDAGVHAHIDHVFALLDLCKKEGLDRVVIHPISDGRDAPVHYSKEIATKLMQKISEVGFGTIGTLSGRYYTMDRDKRWDRTEKAYNAIVKGQADESFTDLLAAFDASYEKEVTDEFIVPMVAEGYSGIKDDDVVVFWNFRSDRPRQLTKALIEEEFEGFDRKPLNIHYVSMTPYYEPMDPRGHIAFPKLSVTAVLGEALAQAGKKQLRISETEKYAHVTFFFNAQQEEPFEGEDRVLIPSPKVATYDLKPEMSVHEIGDRLSEEIDKDLYDVIIVNYVNGDMVGHTGNWDAVVKACEAVEQNVEKTCKKVLEKDGVVLVFADHGNCEEMEGRYKTSHTINPVHLIAVANEQYSLKSGKGLKDIAPTVLHLLGVEKPAEMTGESIVL